MLQEEWMQLNSLASSRIESSKEKKKAKEQEVEKEKEKELKKCPRHAIETSTIETSQEAHQERRQEGQDSMLMLEVEGLHNGAKIVMHFPAKREKEEPLELLEPKVITFWQIYKEKMPIEFINLEAGISLKNKELLKEDEAHQAPTIIKNLVLLGLPTRQYIKDEEAGPSRKEDQEESTHEESSKEEEEEEEQFGSERGW